MTNKQNEVVELCRRMVGAASVNPQDNNCLEEPYGESRMAALVAQWLQDAKLEPQLQEVSPGRENVLAVAQGKDTSKTLLLCGHMDTVDVQDMTIDPFDPQIRDGRIYGRGACDDKGPLAALMIAFRDRVQQGDLPCNLVLLASCGEEYELNGARYWAQHCSGDLAGIVIAEPTRLDVVVAHKGVARVHLVTRGKSAHSSIPKLGQNAIYIMGRALPVVEKFGKELAARPAHPLLNTETLSVTMIQGGQQINVIPDRCTANVDWRILPGRQPEQCRKELAAALQEQLKEPVEVEMINAYESMETSAQHPLVSALLRAGDKATGKCRPISVGYATDASAFTHLGIPTPIFGPGDGCQAHTQDEYIDIEHLEKGVAAYREFLQGDWGI